MLSWHISNLNIFLGGAEYTAEQYNAAKDGLFATNEKAMLNFLDGTLKVQEGEQVVIGGGVTDDKVRFRGWCLLLQKRAKRLARPGQRLIQYLTASFRSSQPMMRTKRC